MPRIISYYVHDSSFYPSCRRNAQKNVRRKEIAQRRVTFVTVAFVDKLRSVKISWIKSSVNWKRSDPATYTWKTKSAVAFFERN